MCETKCPGCGAFHEDDDPREYECPKCGKVAFDCCIAGSNCICFECDEEGGG